MDVPLWLWFAVLGALLIMLLIDLVAHRHAHVIGVREAASWTVVWVLCGIGFGGYIWWHYGAAFGQQYYAGSQIGRASCRASVQVRVDLGGRRIHKKQKKKQ